MKLIELQFGVAHNVTRHNDFNGLGALLRNFCGDSFRESRPERRRRISKDAESERRRGCELDYPFETRCGASPLTMRPLDLAPAVVERRAGVRSSLRKRKTSFVSRV